MTVAKVNFKNANYSNTVKAKTITLTLPNGYDLDGATITMNVKKTPIGAVEKAYTNGSGITVTLPNIATIDQHLMTLTPDTYIYDFNVVFDDGYDITLFGGKWVIDSTL